MHRSFLSGKIVLNKYVVEIYCERTTGEGLFTGGSAIMNYRLIF